MYLFVYRIHILTNADNFFDVIFVRRPRRRSYAKAIIKYTAATNDHHHYILFLIVANTHLHVY